MNASNSTFDFEKVPSVIQDIIRDEGRLSSKLARVGTGELTLTAITCIQYFGTGWGVYKAKDVINRLVSLILHIQTP